MMGLRVTLVFVWAGEAGGGTTISDADRDGKGEELAGGLREDMGCFGRVCVVGVME